MPERDLSSKTRINTTPLNTDSLPEPPTKELLLKSYLLPLSAIRSSVLLTLSNSVNGD